MFEIKWIVTGVLLQVGNQIFPINKLNEIKLNEKTISYDTNNEELPECVVFDFEEFSETYQDSRAEQIREFFRNQQG